jgi:hypothetical protein
VADLIRRGVDLYLTEQIERAISVAGRFSSGETRVSAHHDRYFDSSVMAGRSVDMNDTEYAGQKPGGSAEALPHVHTDC